MTTFTTQDRQDAQRDALTEEVMKIGDALGLKTTSSDYNAIKVMQVIRQLIDASLVASKPMKKRPLTEEEIWKDIPMRRDDIFVEAEAEDWIRFARAIERAHGIGE
jgi:hypothetical protein